MSNKDDARLWVSNAITAQALDYLKSEELSAAYAAIAQVHATLHLAEVVAECIPESHGVVPYREREQS